MTLQYVKKGGQFCGGEGPGQRLHLTGGLKREVKLSKIVWGGWNLIVQGLRKFIYVTDLGKIKGNIEILLREILR